MAIQTTIKKVQIKVGDTVKIFKRFLRQRFRSLEVEWYLWGGSHPSTYIKKDPQWYPFNAAGAGELCLPA